jgi:rod shape-determining protein MreB
MLKRLRGHFAGDLAIDPGTANTLIYVRSRGLALNEPSIVAVQRQSGRGSKVMIAAGTAAKEMLGRTPRNISTIRPMRDGVIADFTYAEAMLQYFIKKVQGRRLLNSRPRVLICVPHGATEVERRAIKESVLGAGARTVDIVPEAMAAAVGAGIAVHEARGAMVMDIGGGTCEIAVISLNGIVYAASIRVAGDRFDEAISQYVRRNLGISIGEVTAERVKMQIGCAHSSELMREMTVVGKNLSQGMPRSCTLNSIQILEALGEPLHAMVGEVKKALEKTPPDLCSDIAEQGIVLTGGGALLRNMATFIEREVGFEVRIAEDPLTCAVRGAGRILEATEASERGRFGLR